MWKVSPQPSGAPVPASGYVVWIPEGKVKHRYLGVGWEIISCAWALSGPLPGKRGQGLPVCFLQWADLMGIPVESDLGPHSPYLCNGPESGGLSDF